MLRRDKLVTKHIETDAHTDRTKAIAAAHHIMALRKGVTLGKGLTIRELIDEGRNKVKTCDVG